MADWPTDHAAPDRIDPHQEKAPTEPVDPKGAKLLQAARRLFLEIGYAATSMDQVAQRANASKTTLYTRFPSKRALFEATIKAECEAFGMRFSVDEFAAADVATALSEIATRFIELVYSPQALRIEQIVAAEGPHFPELAEMYLAAGPEAVSASVADYFKVLAGRGEIATSDPALTAEMFLSLIKNCMAGPRYLAWNAAGPDEAERSRRVAAAIALFLDGTRARQPDAPGRPATR